MLTEIEIKKTENPEEGYESKEQLLDDTVQHIEDVSKVMKVLGNELVVRGNHHDWSKLEFFDNFAQDTLERKDTPDFKSRSWYKIHTEKERHHINAKIPEGIDLIDLLEFICDCTVAGKTRVGEVNTEFLVVPDSVIIEAYWNTVNKIKDALVIVE